jgi:type IV secretory pathway VirB3-like protein
MTHAITNDRSVRLGLWLAAATALAMRAWLLVAHRIDSDEPQHLHVAWAWTRGLVQYRDVFDNHLPLLHLVFAPVMALMPESSAVFVLMRMAIAPVAVGCSLLLFVMVRPRFGWRIAATAALLFSVMPPWLSKSSEFRNDTLWIFFWLAAVALYTRPRGTAAFSAGIMLGLCALASIKAVPLLLAHVLSGHFRAGTRRRLIAGAALPLLIVAIWMFAAGALHDMLYQTLLFNAAAPVRPVRRMGGMLAFVIVAVLVAGPVRVRLRSRAELDPVLFAIWYSVLLLCFWPILTSRDVLPLVPVAAFAIALHASPPVWRTAMVVALLASVVEMRLWRTPDEARQRFVDAAVALTGPEDFVFDLKGEAVFRRRPVSLVYEDVGRALTANGTIEDRGPESIVARRCCAAVGDSSHLPARTRRFLDRHFLGAGLLRVCGTDVRGSAFDIAVPQTYAVVARDPARLLLDGIPYRGPRALAAGRHSLKNGGNEPVRVIWWRAAKEAM